MNCGARSRPFGLPQPDYSRRRSLRARDGNAARRNSGTSSRRHRSSARARDAAHQQNWRATNSAVEHAGTRDTESDIGTGSRFCLSCHRELVSARVAACVRRSGIEDLHFHDLRHEAISRFFEMGLTMPEVALISGHRSPRMLMRYTHMSAAAIQTKLAGLESGPPPPVEAG